jgi:prepilin-type N-terminal cleavage/methylation domain-containing protein
MLSLKNNKKGFTIIEVLIVLAIAGIIMVIVFLAVPSLQRNSRNTGRKSDIGRIGAAVNDWVSNNNGAIFVAGTGNANLTAVNTALGTLGQYTLTPGTNFLVATGNQAALASDNVVVVTGAQCGTNGATTAGSNTRQMALQFQLEGGTSNIASCQNI